MGSIFWTLLRVLWPHHAIQASTFLISSDEITGLELIHWGEEKYRKQFITEVLQREEIQPYVWVHDRVLVYLMNENSLSCSQM